MKTLAYALVLLFSSCSFLDENHYYVDPLLEPFVDKFFEEADKRNVPLCKCNLTVRLQHGHHKKRGAYGTSEGTALTTSLRSVVLDYDAVIYDLQDTGTVLWTERLVFHELGHAILYRKHTKSYSIMNNRNDDYREDYYNDPEKREILIDELFH